MADNNTELSVLQFHMPSLLQGMEVGQRLKTMIKLSGNNDEIEAYLENGMLYIVKAQCVQVDNILEVT